MNEVLGEYFVLNGQSLAINQILEFLDKLETSVSAYEVIRVEEGIPLFVDDYLDRLVYSMASLNFIQNYSREEIMQVINKLISINQHKSGPVKLMLGAGEKRIFIAYIMRPHIPTPEQYVSGVETVVFRASREKPGVKIWNRAMREASSELLKKTGAYEAILVEEDGSITEASRSNVFFVKNDMVFTTPVNLVLPGITRKKVIDICYQLNVVVKFETLSINNISDFDVCFLTGTARKIVPVKNIDQMSFNPNHPVVRKISLAFDDLVADYLHSRI